MNEQTRTKIHKEMGQLVQRLVTEACREQTIAAVKNEGSGVFRTSFEVLGQVAGQSMMTNPAVAKAATEFAQHLDKAAFKELGIPIQ